jgi:hypothetical protein
MSQQRTFYDLPQSDRIVELTRALPSLPLFTRYHDDFADKTHTIRWAETDDVTLLLDGSKIRLRLGELHVGGTLLRHVVVEWFSRLDPHTVANYTDRVLRFATEVDIETFCDLILMSPHEARNLWALKIAPNVTSSTAYALKAMLHALCRLSIGYWSPASSSLVTAFRSPKTDSYRVVRAGECFLPLGHQAIIVNHIDEVCAALSNDPRILSNDILLDTCMLVISYQYAFRPGQIARIEVADVRIFTTGAVHVAVKLIKQKDVSKRIRVTRRIKREWAPLFVELVKRRENAAIEPKEGVPSRLLFGLKPGDVGHAIASLTEELTGEAWSPTDLRHTAAQRLADGGISHLGLSEFMGHTSDRTANVYFDTSPSQAQRVNEALAISPIYSTVVKVAKTKTIDKAALLGLPSDQQIGAVPHGVPIAGIGGCRLGQSLCTRNPVLACYTCSRFMPLGEPEIHEEVLESLRPIVTEFAAASRNNQQSPAYAQLKGTIDAVRRVVEELKAETVEGALT